MKALLNTDNLPVGFFDEVIHAGAIPEGCIDVSTEQWQECLNNSGLRKFVLQVDEYVLEEHVPVKEPRTTGTAREFMALFTKEEKTNIVTMTMADPVAKLWYDEALAGDVYLGHPDVALGLGAMVLAGAISQARVDEILLTDFNA